MVTSVVLIALALASALWFLRLDVRMPLPYLSRNCQGAGWRRAFPEASPQEVRAFLAMFAEAFAFCDQEKLKLNPNDRVLAIYKAFYPSRWMPDALEFNFLARALERTYSVRLADVWRDGLTLGELFECSNRAHR